MEFLKKHYEKIALAVVLLGVAVAAFLLTIEVSNVKQSLADQLQQRARKKGKELKVVDLSTNELALKRAAEGITLELDGAHNTFNPGTWEKSGDSYRRKAGRGIMDLLEYTRAVPLNLVVSFSGVAGLADAPRYQFSVVREFEKVPAKQRPSMASLTAGTKNDLFVLREVKGPPDNPTELVCELLETGERFVVKKDAPYHKTVSYAANLKYEGRELNNKRADDSLNLGGVSYKIVAIAKDELVVSPPNQTRIILKLNPAR